MVAAPKTAIPEYPVQIKWTRENYYRMIDVGLFHGRRAELIFGDVIEPGPDGPMSRKWTRDEYYRMLDAGLFQDRRVQLIDGEIIEMAPQKNPHAVTVGLVEQALKNVFSHGYWVRAQLPLHLGAFSEPEPDVSVVVGSPRDFKEHPATALLVVEISDSTLQFDRNRKAKLYAEARVQDYWIVNLADRCLEVHRQPMQESTGDWRYGEIRTITADGSIAPWAAANSQVKVADLLP